MLMDPCTYRGFIVWWAIVTTGSVVIVLGAHWLVFGS